MLTESVYTTMSTCGLLIWLTVGANAMVGVYNLLGGITYLKVLMTGLPLPPLGVIGVMMAILLMLGCFMDWFSIMLLTMPIFAPAVQALGMTFEPALFLVAADGTVAERLDAVFDEAEIDERLAALGLVS